MYTYASFVAAYAAALEVDAADADFVALLDTNITLAEQRIYRELDLIDTSVAVSGALAANSRYATLPSSQGHLLVVDQINVLDGSSVRHPLVPVSRDVIDFLWPSDAATATSIIPDKFARVDETRVLLGPPPGSAWTAEYIGTIRPAALSASNTSTFLSTYLPDLFFAAAMVAATGTLLKNYGAQADSPQQAVSWEGVYQRHLASALSEEQRKKYQSFVASASH